EPVRDDDVVAGQVVHRCLAQPVQRLADALAQDLQHVADAAFPACGQAPQVGAADHYRARAEGQGLDDVAAAPNAPVEKHFEPVPDRVGHGRQAADGRGGGVEVVAAAV